MYVCSTNINKSTNQQINHSNIPMKSKVKLICGAALSALTLICLAETGPKPRIEQADKSIIIPRPAWKHNRGWSEMLTLFQVESLAGIKAPEGINSSWVAQLQASLSGLILEPKSYDNDPKVMVAYGLLGLGNHHGDMLDEARKEQKKYFDSNPPTSGMGLLKSGHSLFNFAVGNTLDTKEKKDAFLTWCLDESEYILWTLSKEEAEVYKNQMWSARDAVSRPGWLESEKAYYEALDKKGETDKFTSAGADGKTDGRKLTCFVFRRCLDGTTNPSEALAYIEKGITAFEKEAARH